MSGAEGVCIRSGTILPPWIEKVKRKHPKQKKKHRKPVLFPFDSSTDRHRKTGTIVKSISFLLSFSRLGVYGRINLKILSLKQERQKRSCFVVISTKRPCYHRLNVLF